MNTRAPLLCSLFLVACSPSGDTPGHDLAGALDLAAATDDLGAAGDLAMAAGDLAQPAADMASADTVSFSATLVAAGTSTAVAGAKICVFQHPEMACATSDSSGAFTVQLPQNTRSGILIDKAAFVRTLYAVETVIYPFSGSTLPLPPLSTAQSFYSAAGTAYPTAGKGFVRVYFTKANNPGADNVGSTMTLVPAVSGSGPYYANASGAYDSSLTATSSSGLAAAGPLPPNTYEIDVHCGGGFASGDLFGWPIGGSALGKIAVPVLDGYESSTGFSCHF